MIADLAIMMSGHISVPFFPTLKSYELENLIDFGEVKLLFAGKLENWEEQSKGVKNIPIISFPNYKNHSAIPNSANWNDLLEKFEPKTDNYHPKLKDIWTIVFTSGTTGDPKGVVIDYNTIYLTKDIIENNKRLHSVTLFCLVKRMKVFTVCVNLINIKFLLLAYFQCHVLPFLNF